jgi:hypothetical protein
MVRNFLSGNSQKRHRQTISFPCPNDTYVENTIAALTMNSQPPSLSIPDGALPVNHTWLATMVQAMKVQDYGSVSWYQAQISSSGLQCFYCVYGCNDVLLLAINPQLSSPLTCAKFSGKPSTNYGSQCTSPNSISQCIFDLTCL